MGNHSKGKDWIQEYMILLGAKRNSLRWIISKYDEKHSQALVEGKLNDIKSDLEICRSDWASLVSGTRRVIVADIEVVKILLKWLWELSACWWRYQGEELNFECPVTDTTCEAKIKVYWRFSKSDCWLVVAEVWSAISMGVYWVSLMSGEIRKHHILQWRKLKVKFQLKQQSWIIVYRSMNNIENIF